MSEELASLSSDIEVIIERLDDLSFQILRQASQDGQTERPQIDKELVRARRALERAARILSVASE